MKAKEVIILILIILVGIGLYYLEDWHLTLKMTGRLLLLPLNLATNPTNSKKIAVWSQPTSWR